MVANVSPHREGSQSERLKSAVSKTPEVEIQIFKLSGPWTPEMGLNTSPDPPPTQIKVRAECYISGDENAKIVMDFAPSSTAGHVPQPVSIGVAEAGAHGCKPIQLLLGGEEGTTVTGATNTNTRRIFLGCSLEIPFNTDDPIRRELIIVSNLSAPYETGELQAW